MMTIRSRVKYKREGNVQFFKKSERVLRSEGSSLHRQCEDPTLEIDFILVPKKPLSLSDTCNTTMNCVYNELR